MRRIIILGLAFFLTACATNKAVTVVPVSSSPTQIILPTIKTTSTPTKTRTPTSFPKSTTTYTPTIEPTQTMAQTEGVETEIHFPTGTPLVATPISNADYGLVDWTPEHANSLISSLKKYPEGLGYFDRGYHDSNVYGSYDFIRFADSEALLRFPDSNLADSWKWDRAYNMAVAGIPAVNQTYADILSQAILNNQTDFGHLEKWFTEQESRLELKLIPLSPPDGYTTSYLIEISDEYESSGIFIWVVGGPPYHFYPLPSCDGCQAGDFGFFSSSGISYTLEDINGDGVDEILTEHSVSPGNGDALTTSFSIFDIRRVPYIRIEFDPSLHAGFQRTWTTLPDNGKGPGMLFSFVFDSWTCPDLIFQEEYRLENGVFVLADQISPDPNQTALVDAKCADFYFHYLLNDLEDGDKYVLDDLQRWVVNWPYSDMPTSIFGSESQSPDTRDSARFAIGLALAANGDYSAAVEQMKGIISNPTIPTSRWIEIASSFLSKYHKAADFPNACSGTDLCYELFGLRKLVEMYRGDHQVSSLIEYIVNIGVAITNQDIQDINNDSCPDAWITIEYPAYGYSDAELIVCSLAGFKIIQLWSTSGEQPLHVNTISTTQDATVFSVVSAMDEQKYILYRCDSRAGICFDFYTIYLGVKVYSDLDQIEKDLFAEKSPETVLVDLQKIEPLIKQLELERPQQNFELIRLSRWYYLLGLTYELSGDSKLSAENYYHVWEHFPNSPYAIMAKAKLQLVP